MRSVLSKCSPGLLYAGAAVGVSHLVQSRCVLKMLNLYEYGIFGEDEAGNQTIFFLLVLPIILYYPLLEYFFGGKTVGKGLLKIRVTNMEGKPASVGEITMRWLLRSIDIIIGLIIFIISSFFESINMNSDVVHSL